MLSGGSLSAAAAAADLVSYLKIPCAVLAVSGGSDSTALLHLAADARKAAPDCRIIAATVDHGLRPESSVEAAAVAGLSARLGVEHRTLIWRGEKPIHGIQAEARAARQALLAEFVDEVGAGAVLTGHTLDDQAETVLMRSARGEGIGLAGIAPATLAGNQVWFMRPLLGQRRAALRQMLAARGAGWVDDPSNENLQFERVRVRAKLANDPDLFERTVALARTNAAARTRLAWSAAGLLDRFAALEDAATIKVDAALLGSDDEAAVIHALRLLIATAAGGTYLPDHERSAALFSTLRSGAPRAALANASINAADGVLHFSRDTRGRAGPDPRLRSPYEALLPSFDWMAAAAIARMLREPGPCAIPVT